MSSAKMTRWIIAFFLIGANVCLFGEPYDWSQYKNLRVAAELEPGRGTVNRVLGLTNLPVDRRTIDVEYLDTLFAEPNPQALDNLPESVRNLVTGGRAVPRLDIRVPSLISDPEEIARINREIEKGNSIDEVFDRQLGTGPSRSVNIGAQPATAADIAQFWREVDRNWQALPESEKRKLNLDDLPMEVRKVIIGNLNYRTPYQWRTSIVRTHPQTENLPSLDEDFEVSADRPKDPRLPAYPELSHRRPYSDLADYVASVNRAADAVGMQREMRDPLLRNPENENIRDPGTYQLNVSREGADFRQLGELINDNLGLRVAGEGLVRPLNEFSRSVVSYKEDITEQGFVRLKEKHLIEIRLQLDDFEKQLDFYATQLSRDSEVSRRDLNDRNQRLLSDPKALKTFLDANPKALVNIMHRSLKTIGEIGSAIPPNERVRFDSPVLLKAIEETLRAGKIQSVQNFLTQLSNWAGQHPEYQKALRETSSILSRFFNTDAGRRIAQDGSAHGLLTHLLTNGLTHGEPIPKALRDPGVLKEHVRYLSMNQPDAIPTFLRFIDAATRGTSDASEIRRLVAEALQASFRSESDPLFELLRRSPDETLRAIAWSGRELGGDALQISDPELGRQLLKLTNSLPRKAAQFGIAYSGNPTFAAGIAEKIVKGDSKGDQILERLPTTATESPDIRRALTEILRTTRVSYEGETGEHDFVRGGREIWPQNRRLRHAMELMVGHFGRNDVSLLGGMVSSRDAEVPVKAVEELARLAVSYEPARAEILRLSDTPFLGSPARAAIHDILGVTGARFENMCEMATSGIGPR